MPGDFQKTVLPWIYLTLTLLGFVVNGLAMLDLWRSEKTPTVIFTLNIVVSDLMACSSFPFRTAYNYSGLKWNADSTICLTTGFLTISCFYINLYCNMCFLLWTSINRYATVVQPRWGLILAFKRPKICWVLCGATWVLGIVIICAAKAYEVYLFSRSQRVGSCFDQIMKRPEQMNALHATGVGMFFFILGLMLASYGLLIFHLQKAREGSMVGIGLGPGGGLKVRRKILASVVLFVVCFLPYHIQRLKMMAESGSNNCQQNHDVRMLTILVAALSCCLHPMLHLVLRLPCCHVKPNVRGHPKPEVTRSQATPHIQATELPQTTK